jgi:rfaE bifunctional protein kinase chain/domain
METVQLSQERLTELIASFHQARIAVVGDFFLDKYLEVAPELAETSLETGKVAHQVVDVRCSPGAAGTVVSNLAALKAGQLFAVGFTGEDGEGYDLRKGLMQLGCNVDHLQQRSNRHTPTYLKPRDQNVRSLDAEHSRYDTKNHSKTPASIEDQIVASIDALIPNLDALVVMDQVEEADHGVITSRVRREISLRAAQHSQIVFWADSRRRIADFPGLIIKPNQFEAVDRANPAPDEMVPLPELLAAAKQLRSQNQAPVIVTRGAAGMMTSDPDWTLVPGVSVSGPTDPTGAGDSATAGTVLGLCSGASLAEAALIGCLVASITVQQIGTTGVATPAQLSERFGLWQDQQ